MFNFVHGFWFLIFTDGSKVTGDVANAGINRSPSAYLMNPQQERDRYATNVDKEMTVLKFVDGGSGKNIGAFSWFPTHGTSMSRDNKLISGDNKGAAARFFEDWVASNHTTTTFSNHTSGNFSFYILQCSGLIYAHID